MFMHILGILFGYGLLIVLAWWIPSYFGYGKLGEPPWGIRLPIIRDQLIAVIATVALSKLLFVFGLPLLGKFASGAVSALIIYFVWEDVTSWVDRPWATALKDRSWLLYAVIAFSFIWMFL
jgi:hypothetical protein